MLPLLSDEQICFRTKKHVIIFLAPIGWTLIALFFVLNPNPTVVKVSFAPIIAAVVIWINQLLSYVTSAFIITNKRVILSEGFFFRHTNEMRLTTVSNISMNQSLLGRLLNYGTLVIYPFGGNSDLFSDIAAPTTFQKQAQIQLDHIARQGP